MRLFSLYGWVRARYEAKLRRSNFVSAPWAGGVVLLVCVVVAMLLANLPWTAHYYHEFLETGLTRADLSGVQCRHSGEYGLGDSDCDRYRFRGGNSLDAG